MPESDFDSLFVDEIPAAPDPRDDPDRFLYGMALFMRDGQERKEAQLVLACELEAFRECEGSFGEHEVLRLVFRGPRTVYEALDPSDPASAVGAFHHAAEALKPEWADEVWIERGALAPTTVPKQWRQSFRAVLEGRNVDNQAIGLGPIVTWQDLRFRSQSEVRVAEALDRLGVMFLPNCRARVGAGERRRNCEADFLVMLPDSVWGVLEVDGPHHEGKACRDHDRDRVFYRHGAAIVQRYDASRCWSDAEGVVLEFLSLLKQKAR